MSEAKMLANPAEPQAHDTIDLAQLTRAERYKILTGAVIPRPIAFVTTIGPNGGINAAPFSQFVIIAVDPGLLGISIGPRPAGPKDTLVNIKAAGEFVINMVPEGWAETVQQSSEEYPAEVSEVEELGLACVSSVRVRPPRLASSPVQFECRLERIVEVGSAPNHFVIGEVVMMHVARGLSSDCKIDPKAYAPLARIGGRNYVRLGEIIRA
jgi:flavin reductase (DIM6/NTAB) family NADH-FMN oxidoreductase RutF